MPLAAITANFLNDWVEGEVYDPAQWPYALVLPRFTNVAGANRTKVTVLVGGPTP